MDVNVSIANGTDGSVAPSEDQSALRARSGGLTRRIAGTAILAALVVIFDYILRFSGLKIPFPWLPMLRFDFTGVPIALSLLLYGVSSGASTSLVAALAIIARSGDVVGGVMKAIAEFSTILGMAAGLRLPGRWGMVLSLLAGVALRIAILTIANLIILPTYYGMPYTVAVSLLPMIGIFNAIQGVLTILFAYLLYGAYVRRVGKESSA
jgi:riboflavin transporter FmnP